jgi:hypothetical protein
VSIDGDAPFCLLSDFALPEWMPFHQNKITSEESWGERRPSACHLRNGPDHCTVDPADYEDRFPCLDPNKILPRKKSKPMACNRLL